MKINDVLDEGINDPSLFKAIITAGPPGSGKSYVIDKITAGLGMKVVNIDHAYEYLVKKSGGDLKSSSKSKPDVKKQYDRAWELTRTKLDNYLDGRLGIVLDTTAKNTDRIMKVKRELEEEGYDVMVVYVKTDLTLAIKRNKERERTVDVEFIKHVQDRMKETIHMLYSNFRNDRIVIVDNNIPNQEFGDVWKKVKTWASKKPTDPRAKEWIQNQQRKRMGF